MLEKLPRLRAMIKLQLPFAAATDNNTGHFVRYGFWTGGRMNFDVGAEPGRFAVA